jgi:hypothetical protein
MATGHISGALVGGIADPTHIVESDAIAQQRASNYSDASVTFEEYHYWANRSREIEKKIAPSSGQGLLGLFSRSDRKKRHEQPVSHPPEVRDEKDVIVNPSQDPTVMDGSSAVTDSEWNNARGAMRTATWGMIIIYTTHPHFADRFAGSIFYLITTDILGPYNVPWAISKMGYGPGFALYTVFGGFACYSGIQLWQMFLGLDSTKYPLRNYGDLAFRVFGKWARYLFNILQTFQFFLMVALLTESNGQGLAQMAAGKKGTGFLCCTFRTLSFFMNKYSLFE